MIEQVDRFLARLLRDRTPLHSEEVTFDAPDDGYRSRHAVGQTVNLYLYDLRENHDLRATEWTLEPRGDGGFVRTPPKSRVDLLYLVTTWDAEVAEPDILAEHALLSRVLRTLLAYPNLPEGLLPGPPLGQGLPLPTLVIQPETLRNPADLWGALRQAPRPALYLVVTVPMPPAPDPDGQRPLIPVASRQVGMAQGGGQGYRLTVRPALSGPLPMGSLVRRAAVEAVPLARLQTPVFAARDHLRVSRAQLLAPHDWALLDDAAASEFVLVGDVSGSGEQTVPLSLPIRAPHDTGSALRQLLASDSDRIVTTLAAPVAANAASLALEDGAGLAAVSAGSVLLISDGARSEPVRASAAPSPAGDLALDIRPRTAHPAGCPLYLRTLATLPPSPGDRCTLIQPAGQPGATLVLDAAALGDGNGSGAPGLFVMVGAGGRVELGRLTAGPAGTPLSVVPPLRGSHAAGTVLRQITLGEQVGEVLGGGAAGSRELQLLASASAASTVRRTGRPVLAAGDVIAVSTESQSGPAGEDDTTVLLQVTGLTEEAALPGTVPELLFAIGGRALDDATPPEPVIGARISLSQNGAGEPLLTATTDADGRFRFANVQAGAYQLRATATGYQPRNQEATVPATRADEYRITLLR